MHVNCTRRTLHHHERNNTLACRSGEPNIPSIQRSWSWKGVLSRTKFLCPDLAAGVHFLKGGLAGVPGVPFDKVPASKLLDTFTDLL